MKIAIIGTRGIPNNYGGFEQCAEYLALGLAKRGFEVIVYSPHDHPYQENNWNGVEIIHCYDPEHFMGTAGQFIYDLNCILNLRKQNCDIVLQLGYTSSSIWASLLPRKAVITTNMDGLEWKRTKYSEKVRTFLQYAEKLAVKNSDHLIADSIGIQEYLNEKYNAASVYIPYGADVFNDPDIHILTKYPYIKGFEYNLLIARLEPENSIDIILEGCNLAATQMPIVVIGNHTTKYGEYLKAKYKSNDKIKFIGSIYNINDLNNLRYYSNIYFHGHTVGGTNPSLLEAMASNALICANDNKFNYSILEKDAFYFKNEHDVAKLIDSIRKPDFDTYLNNNKKKIQSVFSWDEVVDQYIDHFLQIYKKS